MDTKPTKKLNAGNQHQALEPMVPMHMRRDQASWRSIIELLQAREYEQAESLIQDAKASSEKNGDQFQVRFLEAIKEICLTQYQCVAKMKSQMEVTQEAFALVQMLEKQLWTILELVFRISCSELHKDFPISSFSEPGSQSVNKFLEGLDSWWHVLGWIQEKLSHLLREKVAAAEVPVLASELLPQDHPQSSSEVSLGSPAIPDVESAEATGVFTPQERKRIKATPPSLTIHCLGFFKVYENGLPIEKWPGNQCVIIFKYFVCQNFHPVHKEVLMELFWRGIDPKIAQKNLFQAIYNLRKVFRKIQPNFQHILYENECYLFNPEIQIWVDSEAFMDLYQEGLKLKREGDLPRMLKSFELAEQLYEGEFLCEDLYEDWSLVERENLKHAYLDILQQLSQYYYLQGQHALSIAYCRKILTADRVREDAHRRLMRCYLHQNLPHLALQQYCRCVEALREELDVPPMPATIQLYQEIQEQWPQFKGRLKMRG